MAVKKTRTKTAKAGTKKKAAVEVSDSGDEVYEVEKILDKRETPSQGIMYYVKWKNYPAHANTWEPLENLNHTTLVGEFENSLLLSKNGPTTTNNPKKKADKPPQQEDLKEEDEDELEEEEQQEEKMKDEEVEMEAEVEEKPVPATKNGRSKAAAKPKAAAAPTRARSNRAGAAAALVSSPKEAKVKRELKKTTVKRAPRGKKAPEPVAPLDESDGSEEEEEAEATPAAHEIPTNKTFVVPAPAAAAAAIDFSKFKPTRIINQSMESKFITFFGKYDGKEAVIKLEKTVFDEADMKQAFKDDELKSERTFVNDIYSSYVITPPTSSALNELKVTVVCPSNDSVLAKYSKAEKILYNEPPEVYANVVEPFIKQKLDSDEDPNRWVYNILEGVSEADRVIMNDPNLDSGFMLVEDLKCSDKEVILLAICHRRDIRSLRDLHDKHLTLLRNILTKGTQAVRDKYKKSKGELRSYIHYQPSFYHFHVHFRMVDPADHHSTDRDHLLSTVINNITMNKLYYKKSTLTYPLSIESELYKNLKDADRL